MGMSSAFVIVCAGRERISPVTSWPLTGLESGSPELGTVVVLRMLGVRGNPLLLQLRWFDSASEVDVDPEDPEVNVGESIEEVEWA
jgi:hypothetical protein